MTHRLHAYGNRVARIGADDLEPARGAVMAFLMGMWFWMTSFLIAGWIFR